MPRPTFLGSGGGIALLGNRYATNQLSQWGICSEYQGLVPYMPLDTQNLGDGHWGSPAERIAKTMLRMNQVVHSRQTLVL